MCQKLECPHKGDVMCSCKEIQGPDWVEKIVCLFQNIREPRAELLYMTLDAPRPYRLCVSGSCKRCGGRLCIQLDRSGVCGRDDFLAMVYRRLYQIFNVDFEMEIKAFRQMFLELFHEQDRPYIQYWLTLPGNQDISQMYRSMGDSLPPRKECESPAPALEEEPVKVYTIVQTAVNADRGFFPDPFSWGSYLSLDQARERLTELIAAAKKDLSDRYNREDISEDHWEAYEDGCAAACFMRIEVLTSELFPAQKGGPCHA